MPYLIILSSQLILKLMTGRHGGIYWYVESQSIKRHKSSYQRYAFKWSLCYSDSWAPGQALFVFTSYLVICKTSTRRKENQVKIRTWHVTLKIQSSFIHVTIEKHLVLMLCASCYLVLEVSVFSFFILFHMLHLADHVTWNHILNPLRFVSSKHGISTLGHSSGL